MLWRFIPERPLSLFGSELPLATRDVTQTIAEAMENADRMKHVLIIYSTVDGERAAYGLHNDERLTLKEMNYMVDIAKSWCLQNFDFSE